MDGRPLAPGIYVWRMEWPQIAGKAARSEQGAVTILR